ncbi:MAG: Holliday junction resolvase RuvX [Vicinamibacterales bacterium]
MRVLGVDYGAKRIGLALSDYTGTLARPWQMVLSPGGPRSAAKAVAGLVTTLRQSDDPDLDQIVVGLPRRLNGEDTDQTPAVRQFVMMLAELTGLPVDTQDERLTSIEAESRLAEHETDWRKRKKLVDAEAASIFLQDYLDTRTGPSGLHRGDE